MSELENAEKEARKWMREDTPVAPNSLYWSRVLSERDVLKGQLDAMEEQLAAKDARIAELERSRPLGDWPEARKLREAFASMGHADQHIMLMNMEDWDSKELAAALRAFCESQPPAPSPVREVVVESPKARKLRDAWANLGAETRLHLSAELSATWSVNLAASLAAFCESQPPASAPSDEAAHYKAVAQQNAAALTECQRERDERTRQVAQLQDDLKVERAAYGFCREARIGLTAQLNEQAAKHAAEGERWAKEMGAKDAELRAAREEARTWKNAHAEYRMNDSEHIAAELRHSLAQAREEIAALKSAPRYVQATVETMLGYHVAEWQDLLSWVERHSNPPAGERFSLVELAERAAHSYVAGALKSAPVRFEREVDAELRAAISNHAHWADPTQWCSDDAKRASRALKAWLAAPISAPDEYARAAVDSCELAVRVNDDPLNNDLLKEADRAWDRFRKLYAARHSAAASAPEGEKAAPAFNASDWTPGKARAFNEMTASEVRAMMNAAPAPADGERVTVYAMRVEYGDVAGSLYSEKERRGITLRPGCSWLALDARVVREGGAS